ncbi:MAG: hypothetical protein QOE83_1278 [Actinomycetota bacterium]|jgi:hypothetical protein|nr:hypothetical protein [Actinomycetota bacterium]
MAGFGTALPSRGVPAFAWVVIGGGVIVSILAVGASTPDVQMFLALSAIITALGALIIPRVVRRDGTLSASFLGAALGAHVIGALLRFTIIQAVYGGVADANGYFSSGVQLAPLFRSLQIPPFPRSGTPFIDWFSGLLFAVITPTMLGGFVVCAALGFIGCWYFYKAFRMGFPEGDDRLVAKLIFFLPSMWYWPSSLGKDGLIVCFMGIATYGFTCILRSRFGIGLLSVVFGLFGVIMIRPPMAAALAIAAVAAFILRPARAASVQMQAITLFVLGPILLLVAGFTVQSSLAYMHNQDPIAAYESQASQDFSARGGTSNYSVVSPFTPKGFLLAVVTVNFRPLPGEAGGLLPTLAALEGALLIFLLWRRRREIGYGVRHWRQNGMVLFAALAWLAMSLILSSLGNFGLLARQRTQVLPFLFMLICMVRPQARRSGAVPFASAP